jgi:hypothetical protein
VTAGQLGQGYACFKGLACLGACCQGVAVASRRLVACANLTSCGSHVCLVQDIIGRFPDLMEGFNRFLARCETMDAVDNEMRGQFGSQRGISQREMARLKGQSARCGSRQRFSRRVAGACLCSGSNGSGSSALSAGLSPKAPGLLVLLAARCSLGSP